MAYEVTGTHRKTNKRVTREYDVESELLARQLAVGDLLVDIEAYPIPPTLASEEAVEEARRLGVVVPPYCTYRRLQYLLEEKTEPRASAAQLHVAERAAVVIEDDVFPSRKRVVDAIHDAFDRYSTDWSVHEEMIVWWLISVACDLTGKPWRYISEQPISRSFAERVARQVYSDIGYREKILHELRFEDGAFQFDVVSFGTGADGTLRRSTDAYSCAASIISDWIRRTGVVVHNKQHRLGAFRQTTDPDRPKPMLGGPGSRATEEKPRLFAILGQLGHAAVIIGLVWGAVFSYDYMQEWVAEWSGEADLSETRSDQTPEE